MHESGPAPRLLNSPLRQPSNSRDRATKEPSDADLVDLVLGGLPCTGVGDSSLGHRLLAAAPLRRLATRTDTELARLTSLDPADVRRVAALFELSRRLLAARLPRGETFLNPRQIFDYFHTRLRDLKKEVFCVVLLDARHRIMGEERISEGSLTSSIVHPREVFVPAVRESAGAVVFVHNHPSGEPTPSEDDIAVTRRLEHAAELLGIRVLDHVIVGDGEYTSFKEVGLM